MIAWLLLVLAAMGWMYWVAATWLTLGFFRPRAGRGAEPTPAGLPPVSVLKPVKGLDFAAYESFATFCRQDYPRYELLFGVASARDAAIPVIERLRRDFPAIPIRLHVTPPVGANSKASILHGLAQKAEHDVLVVSDSDIEAPPDCLWRVVAPLADPVVGMVVTAYRGGTPRSFAALLEALYIGPTFLPGVLVARIVLRMRFALGACLALRRADLGRIGGFAAVADFLADDYQLGRRVAGLGLRVALIPLVVTCSLGPTRLVDTWRREVRWSRCTRSSRPLGFFGLLLTMPTPFALLAVVAGGGGLAWAAVAISLVVRWAAAAVITTVMADPARRLLALLPLRDVVTAVVWAASALGRTVWWRGERYRVNAEGTLEVPPRAAGRAYPAPSPDTATRSQRWTG